MARSIIGRTGEQVQQASDDWQAYLAREKDDLPDWPDLALLAAGRDYPARYPSMRLAFEAAASLLTKEAAEDRRHG
jgi:NifU-like protein involved in Fe-S cluster formation